MSGYEAKSKKTLPDFRLIMGIIDFEQPTFWNFEPFTFELERAMHHLSTLACICLLHFTASDRRFWYFLCLRNGASHVVYPVRDLIQDEITGQPLHRENKILPLLQVQVSMNM